MIILPKEYITHLNPETDGIVYFTSYDSTAKVHHPIVKTPYNLQNYPEKFIDGNFFSETETVLSAYQSDPPAETELLSAIDSAYYEDLESLHKWKNSSERKLPKGKTAWQYIFDELEEKGYVLAV